MSDLTEVPVTVTAPTPDALPGIGSYSVSLISVAHRIATMAMPTEADFAELRAAVREDADDLNAALDRAIAGTAGSR